MKTKILMSVLAIGMAIALIGGATMAWFTDEAEVTPAEFTAGTVIVDADGPEYFPAEGKFFENVNPGDCGRVEWTIINEGTKAAEIRVKLEEAWEDDGLSTENFFYAPAPNSDWVMYYEEEEGEDKGIWLYYTGGPVAGTYGLGEGEAPESVELELVVYFDGELTDDTYQGKKFELSGKVYAIQASNDAPLEVWGEAWDVVTESGYQPTGLAAAYLEYIQDTKCWDGEVEEPEEEEEEEEEEEPAKYTLQLVKQKFWLGQYYDDVMCGTVEGGGSGKEVGKKVTLKATPNRMYGFSFDGWYTEADGGGDFLGTGDLLGGTYYYDYINETASDGETVMLYAVFKWGY